MVILKANFKPVYKPVLWTFRSENSTFLYSFSFYFLQELSNPLLFAYSYCYFKKVEMFESHFCIKLQFKYVCQVIEIAATVWKKQWKWQLLQKIVHNTSMFTGLKFAFKITITKPDFLWNVNVQIATVCHGLGAW